MSYSWRKLWCFLALDRRDVSVRMCCMVVIFHTTSREHGVPAMELAYCVPFKTCLLYIFHVCVSAGWRHAKAAWSRADGSHQSRYFTFPGSALWSLPWSAVPCSPHGTRSRLGSVGGSLSCESVSPGKGIAPAWLRRREAQFGEICWESRPLMRKAWAGWE